VQLLRNSWAKGTDEYDSLTYIHQQGILASNSARDIAHNLLPPTLESFGLKAAIDEYLDQVNKAMVIQASLQTNGDISLLSSEYQLHIFRIVQELINNSLKHSEATTAVFNIDFDTAICHCCYKDNGKGFDMSSLQASGIGLQSIKSRIQFMNGTMALLTSPGNGFQLNFEFYGNDSPGNN
jgi:signal transduction histidine kinase